MPKRSPTPFCLTSNVDPGRFRVAILLAHGQGRQGPAGCVDLTWAFGGFGWVPWESQPVSTLLPAQPRLSCQVSCQWASANGRPVTTPQEASSGLWQWTYFEFFLVHLNNFAAKSCKPEEGMTGRFPMREGAPTTPLQLVPELSSQVLCIWLSALPRGRMLHLLDTCV